MSGRQVVRKLKALTGQTAVEFIRNQRLERAVQLLGEDKSVSEVAYACVIRKFALIYEGVRGEILGATLGLRTRS